MARTTIIIDIPDDVWHDVQEAARSRRWDCSPETLLGLWIEQYWNDLQRKARDTARQERGADQANPDSDPTVDFPDPHAAADTAEQAAAPVWEPVTDEEDGDPHVVATRLIAQATRMLERAQRLLGVL